jgi:hypothetical protein
MAREVIFLFAAVGLLSAIDQLGQIKWQHKTERPLIGGVLAAAGGLVFTGEGNGRSTRSIPRRVPTFGIIRPVPA